jgi:hypothetical protein
LLLDSLVAWSFEAFVPFYKPLSSLTGGAGGLINESFIG